jgi:sugar phosphate isomerase/epimerase
VADLHPRVSVSSVCTFAWALCDDLRLWAEMGLSHGGIAFVTMQEMGLDRAVAAIRAAGLRVSTLIGLGPFRLDRPEQWPGCLDALLPVMDAAADLEAGSLVLTPGGAGSLSWEEAAARFEDVYAPAVAEARDRGVTLAFENTGWLRFENGFTTTLRDTIDIAAAIEASVCVEVNNCWMERDLAGCFRRSVSRFSVVQLSDYVEGTGRTPDRAVPGDGMIPLRRIVEGVLDAGYGGPFELEILGPRIEAEGAAVAVRRGARWMSDLLDDIGVRR